MCGTLEMISVEVNKSLLVRTMVRNVIWFNFRPDPDSLDVCRIRDPRYGLETYSYVHFWGLLTTSKDFGGRSQAV